MGHGLGQMDCFLLGNLIMGIFGGFLCSFWDIWTIAVFFFLRVLVRV